MHSWVDWALKQEPLRLDFWLTPDLFQTKDFSYVRDVVVRGHVFDSSDVDVLEL